MIKEVILLFIGIIIFLCVVNKVFKIDSIKGTILNLLKAFGFVALGLILLFFNSFSSDIHIGIFLESLWHTYSIYFIGFAVLGFCAGIYKFAKKLYKKIKITKDKRMLLPKFLREGQIHKFLLFVIKDNFNLFMFFTICYSLFFIAYDLIMQCGDTDIPSFQFCKWLIFISSGITTAKLYKQNEKTKFLFVFGVICILFNPIRSIQFEYVEHWLIFVFFALITYCVFLYKLFNKNNE